MRKVSFTEPIQKSKVAKPFRLDCKKISEFFGNKYIINYDTISIIIYALKTMIRVHSTFFRMELQPTHHMRTTDIVTQPLVRPQIHDVLGA